MELINTIEIRPYNYKVSDYAHPKGSRKDFPDEHDIFWRKCLSDKNLENLNPIKKGSDLVDIETIKNQELEEIIKNQLKDVDLEDYEEQVGRIEGGIVIKIENEFPIEPTCCGDIGNIGEWEEIFKNKTDNWNQMWIGHPWIFYKRVNNTIEFSDYSDLNVQDLKEIKTLLILQADELYKRLKVLKEQQIVFEKRIKIVLDKLDIKNSKEIAKLMTGNE